MTIFTNKISFKDKKLYFCVFSFINVHDNMQGLIRYYKPVGVTFKLCTEVVPTIDPTDPTWNVDYVVSPNRRLPLTNVNIV